MAVPWLIVTATATVPDATVVVSTCVGVEASPGIASGVPVASVALASCAGMPASASCVAPSPVDIIASVDASAAPSVLTSAPVSALASVAALSPAPVSVDGMLESPAVLASEPPSLLEGGPYPLSVPHAPAASDSAPDESHSAPSPRAHVRFVMGAAYSESHGGRLQHLCDERPSN